MKNEHRDEETLILGDAAQGKRKDVKLTELEQVYRRLIEQQDWVRNAQESAQAAASHARYAAEQETPRANATVRRMAHSAKTAGSTASTAVRILGNADLDLRSITDDVRQLAIKDNQNRLLEQTDRVRRSQEIAEAHYQVGVQKFHTKIALEDRDDARLWARRWRRLAFFQQVLILIAAYLVWTQL